jgi:hypothetical protein
MKLAPLVVTALAACSGSGPSYKQVAAETKPQTDRLLGALAKVRAALDEATGAPMCGKRADLTHWDGGKAGNLGLIDRGELDELATGTKIADADARVYLGLDLDDMPFFRVVSFIEPKSPYYLAESTQTATNEIAGWFRSISAVTHVLVVDRGVIDRTEGTAGVHGFLADLGSGRVECRIHVLARGTAGLPDREYDVVQRNTRTGETKVLRTVSEDQLEGELDHEAKTQLEAQIEEVFGFSVRRG